MRHRKKRTQLGRKPAHRESMLVNLACSLIEQGRVVTSPEKAKAVRPLVEHMITLGKRGTLAARRLAIKRLHDRRIMLPRGQSMRVVKRLFDEIAPLFAGRNGGYTRIIRLPRTIRLSANETFSGWRKAQGLRLGDAGEQVYFELVGYQPPTYEKKTKGKAAKGGAEPESE